MNSPLKIILDPLAPEIAERLQQLEIYKSYKRSKYLSLKHSSYFPVYEEMLSRYRGKNIAFIEIGVLNGGSLFMWRDFFGPGARIIGVDANPEAIKWKRDDFEIYIGSQSDEAFWDRVFATVGSVDVVLDDGGHANEQQIITAEKCLPHIRDGGMLIVEDTHSSYLTRFGNPSKFSFINYTKSLIDSVNSRFPSVTVSQNRLNEIVSSMEIYESIVCFRVDRSKCFTSALLSNDGVSAEARDFRDHGSILHDSVDYLIRMFPALERSTVISKLGTRFARRLFSIRAKFKSRHLGRFFR